MGNKFNLYWLLSLTGILETNNIKGSQHASSTTLLFLNTW